MPFSEDLFRDLEFDDQDSSPYVPKCVVVDQSYDWEGDKLPKIPFHKTVIYETHVKGFSVNHPEIDPNIRGTAEL